MLFILLSFFHFFRSFCVVSFFQKHYASWFSLNLVTTDIKPDERPPLLKKLNYCMLFAKHYLYNQKLNQIEPVLNLIIDLIIIIIIIIIHL